MDSKTLINVFQEKSAKFLHDLGPLSETEINNFKTVIALMGQCLPETVLVGGWALRLHLEKNGFIIPKVPYKSDYLDLDYEIDNQNYSRVRNLLAPTEDKGFVNPYGPFPPAKATLLKRHFRRKERDFDKADRQIPLENTDRDPQKRKHIELFSQVHPEDHVTEFRILKIPVKTQSPEGLFLRRINKIKKIVGSFKGKQKIELPSKNYYYLFMAGSLLKPAFLDQNNNLSGVSSFINNLESKIAAQEIVLVDTVA